MPDKMARWTIGMVRADGGYAPSVARSARSADTCFAKVCSLTFSNSLVERGILKCRDNFILLVMRTTRKTGRRC